jgi:hypothetical protein
MLAKAAKAEEAKDVATKAVHRAKESEAFASSSAAAASAAA